MASNGADGGNRAAAAGRDEVRRRDRTDHRVLQSNRCCCPESSGGVDEADATSTDRVGATGDGQSASLPDAGASRSGAGSRRCRRASRICRLSSAAKINDQEILTISHRIFYNFCYSIVPGCKRRK